MIKQHFRYRNFMIVFEDDRYYICKASSFSKNGTNRYNWSDIETVDEAKKIIDKYWEENDKEVNESMVNKNKYRRMKKIESKEEDLEILNEFEDEDDGNPDIEYPKNPNLFNLTDYYMDAYDLDYDNALECARGDLAGMGKFTQYEVEATNPSNIGHHKRSPLATVRKKKECIHNEIVNEDRIITKDDELNKPTNVKDDDTKDDTIDINVSTNNTNATNNSNDNNDDKQQKDEVVLVEQSDFDKSNIVIEKDVTIDTKFGKITINRVYSQMNPFEDKIETYVDIENEKDGKKTKYNAIPVEKIYSYME